MARRPRPALAVAVAVLLAAGGALVLRPDPPDPTAARDGRIVLRMVDFRFEPQRIVSAPGPLTFELRNEGRLPHNFRLLRSGNEVVQIDTLQPGEPTTVTRRVTRGVYRILCPLSNHAELGMYGTLNVR